MSVTELRTALLARVDRAPNKLRRWLGRARAYERGALFVAIDAWREECGITVTALAGAGGITENWYRTLRARPAKASAAVLTRLVRARAVATIGASPSAGHRRARACYLAAFAAAYAVFGDRPDLRRIALYLSVTGLELQQQEAAAVAGVTRAAVCLALQAIEDRRDDPAFERAIAHCEAVLLGE